MTPIEWKSTQEEAPQLKSKHASTESPKNDIWFGVALCLMGLIGGYLLATAL